MSNLRVAGPTPFYPQVYDALQYEMVTHRGPEYQKLHASVVEKLHPFFGTTSNIYLITSSGTGAMEAAITNFYSPSDKILSFSCGGFGDRWALIAKAYGADVIKTRFTMGEVVDFDKAEEIMKENSDAKGVLITYCETSGTVLNDIKAFAKLSQKFVPKALIMVDAISVLGAAPMKMDEWGVDVVVTGSQKSWSAPPGIAMIAISKRAKEKMGHSKMPRFYFDLKLFDKYGRKNQTPTTPAVGSLYGLEAALEVMLNEGLENVFNRHVKLRDRFRRGVRDLNLKLLCDDAIASPTITAVVVPEGVNAKEWVDLMKNKHDTVVSGGKKELKGKVIRIAHMGNVSKKDIDDTIDALTKSLKDLKRS